MAEAAISVSVECAAWEELLPGAEAAVIRFARAALASRPAFDRDVELDIALADDRTVQDLNRDWRGKDAPTNVLAFARQDGAAPPLLPGQPLMLGDVILAFETCAAEAKAAGLPFEHHAAHLVVHGVLHLLGLDHQDEDEARAMEAAETAILADFGIADPHLERRP